MAYEDVIEYSCIGKTGNDNECQDVIVQGEHFYAVIDGVTSKYPVTYGGKSAGRYCAELLKNEILRLFGYGRQNLFQLYCRLKSVRIYLCCI